MKALDTNVIVRFLLKDDEVQSIRVNKLLETAEQTSDRFQITWPVVLEIIWVLTAVYEFQRAEVLGALELLLQMPVLQFEDHDGVARLIQLGHSSGADLPDLLIGLSGKSCGCESTLTFEKGLAKTGLFERL